MANGDESGQRKKGKGLGWLLIGTAGLLGIVATVKATREPEQQLFPSCDPDTCNGICSGGICVPLEPLLNISHTECRAGQCINVFGLGEDECSVINQDCQIIECLNGDQQLDYNGQFCESRNRGLQRSSDCINNQWQQWTVIENCPPNQPVTCGIARFWWWDDHLDDYFFMTEIENTSNEQKKICMVVIDEFQPQQIEYTRVGNTILQPGEIGSTPNVRLKYGKPYRVLIGCTDVGSQSCDLNPNQEWEILVYDREDTGTFTRV